MRVDLLLLLSALVMTPAPALAQDAITLRYQPRMNLPVRLHHVTTIGVTITDMSAQIADSTGELRSVDSDSLGMFEDMGTLTMELSHTLTRQAVDRRNGGWIVDVQLEPVRGRMTDDDGEWQVLPGVDSIRGMARMVVTELLEIESVEPAGGGTLAAGVEDLVRTMAGDLELHFPEAPVTVGDTWSTVVRRPLPSDIVGGQAEPQMAGGPEFPDELVSRATATLDSLRPRGPDTLAYLSVVGAYDPVSVAGAEGEFGGGVEMTGAFSARLVWSTGWGAVVQGASRSRLDMVVDLTLGQMGRVSLALELDMRSQVTLRP